MMFEDDVILEMDEKLMYWLEYYLILLPVSTQIVSNILKLATLFYHSTYYMTKSQSYYDTYTNSISLPFGYFHYPLYSSRTIESMNYGAIGFAIGHEVSWVWKIILL